MLRLLLETSTGDLVALAGACALFGVILITIGRTSLRRHSALVETDTVPIAEATPGLVEIEGHVLPLEDELEGPMSGERCVAYHHEIERLRRRRKRRSWRTVHKERATVPFCIDDGTGKLEVDPDTIDLELQKTIQLDEDELDAETRDQYTTTIADDGLLEEVEATISGQTNRLRATERTLTVGEPVVAIGTLQAADGRHVLVGEGAPVAFLSDERPEALVSSLFWKGTALTAGGILALGGTLITLLVLASRAA